MAGYSAMSRSNIVLIGMPGSGKSTIGVLLAKELCMKFLDTDVMVQNSAQKSLQDIIETSGIDTLLSLEARSVCHLMVTNTVIAPGGSIVLSSRAMDHLSEIGTIVYLAVPLNVIRGRIDIYTRGIVKRPEESIDDVFDAREPLYQRWAGKVIECGDMTHIEVVREIIDSLGGSHRDVPGTIH